MSHEIETNFVRTSDEAIKYRLGITDFHKRYISYGKILYNHSILSYDSESIYFIDKLHITFCSIKKVDKCIADAFYKREQCCIDEHLILKPNYKNGNNYHYSFKIEYNGTHFGYLHLCNTKKTNINKVELDNRVLYERSIIYILARIYHLACSIGLRFNNINCYEIARDTPVQLYSRMSEIYYQSTKCNKTIHELTGIKPQFKPVTKAKIHDYPDDNGYGGTFVIGANKSESIVRIYNKTPEIADNCYKKEYIHEIHVQHFGLEQNISRVEVTIFANAFRHSGILGTFDCNLIEILISKNLPSMYYKALGDKLTFNNLSTKSWDEANNDKYEKIRLIPTLDNHCIQQRRIFLEPSATRFSHNNNINKYKFKLVEYLDGDIPYTDLKRYFLSKKGKNGLNMDEVFNAYKIIKQNYNNPLNFKQNIRITKLIKSLGESSILYSLKVKLRHFLRNLYSTTFVNCK